MSVLHADFTGTATNLFSIDRPTENITISIADQGSNADGVYYLQHVDYTGTAAWVDMVSSDDAITANSSGSVCKVFRHLPAGIYRLNTASETGTVDIFISAENLELSGITDPTA